MEILRYILMGIFVLLCIVATVLVLLQQVDLRVIGVEIKDVPWKEIWKNGRKF